MMTSAVGRPPSFHGSSGAASSFGVCGRSVFSASPPVTNSPLRCVDF
jgi:hypothetical protein